MRKNMTRIQSQLSFLSLEQRMDFQFKSSRHAIATNIATTWLKNPKYRGRKQKIAAQFQIRHKPKDQETIDESYLFKITEDEFYEILDCTINFPWEINMLRDWERQHGYTEEEEIVIEDVLLGENNVSGVKEQTKIQSAEDKKFKLHLESLRRELLTISSRPKNMPWDEWAGKRKKLQKQINQIELKLFI